MTPAADPQRRFRQGAAAQVAACCLFAGLAAAWAWHVPGPAAPPPAAAADPAGAAPPAAAAIDLAAWNMDFWRPFGEQAQPTQAAAPSAFKLYSILQQDDGLTAAISTGDNAGMQYVKAGDSGNGFTVVRVEANGVVLRINGQEQRLGLGP